MSPTPIQPFNLIEIRAVRTITESRPFNPRLRGCFPISLPLQSQNLSMALFAALISRLAASSRSRLLRPPPFVLSSLRRVASQSHDPPLSWPRFLVPFAAAAASSIAFSLASPARCDAGFDHRSMFLFFCATAYPLYSIIVSAIHSIWIGFVESEARTALNCWLRVFTKEYQRSL